MTTAHQINLPLPEGADQFDAAVFTQDGEWVHCGHREECEDLAQDIGGLYCWIDRGRAILRRDFTQRWSSEAGLRRTIQRHMRLDGI